MLLSAEHANFHNRTVTEFAPRNYFGPQRQPCTKLATKGLAGSLLKQLVVFGGKIASCQRQRRSLAMLPAHRWRVRLQPPVVLRVLGAFIEQFAEHFAEPSAEYFVEHFAEHVAEHFAELFSTAQRHIWMLCT